MPATDASPAPTRSRLQVATSYEAGIWRSLFRWLTRRPRAIHADAALFGYGSQATPILLAFIFLSALEIPILPLVLPWTAVRYSLLVLGIWGLLWMLGLLASIRTYPHTIDTTGLRLRSGFQFEASIPWQKISTIRLRRSSSGRKLQIDRNESGSTVALHGTNNVEVTFQGPVLIRFLDGRQASVDALRFYADSPAALVSAAQDHLARIRDAA